MLPPLQRGRPAPIFELVARPSDQRFWNADLAPTRIADRTWTTYNIASLWVGLSVCIPTYMLAALAAGIVVALAGLAVPALRVLFDYACFVGFGVAFGT